MNFGLFGSKKALRTVKLAGLSIISKQVNPCGILSVVKTPCIH